METADTVAVKPQGGVRYVVPQRLVKGEGQVALYFRVGNAYKPARLTVKCGEEVLKTQKKMIMTPGEMEKVVIDLAKVNGDVTVCVEEA